MSMLLVSTRLLVSMMLLVSVLLAWVGWRPLIVAHVLQPPLWVSRSFSLSGFLPGGHQSVGVLGNELVRQLPPLRTDISGKGCKGRELRVSVSMRNHEERRRDRGRERGTGGEREREKEGGYSQFDILVMMADAATLSCTSAGTH